MATIVMAALAGGWFAFLVAVLLFLVGAIIALYTNVGSGMSHHPYRSAYLGAPGAELPCEDCSGSDRTFLTEERVHAEWARKRGLTA